MNNNNKLSGIGLSLFGKIDGKRILHLQSQPGGESISFARAGASVVAIDCSEASVAWAQEQNEINKLDIEFIVCDTCKLKEKISGKFDYIFSSYGSMNWVDDIELWAETANYFLKENGNLILIDLHPFRKMNSSIFEQIDYSSFQDFSANHFSTKSTNKEIEEILLPDIFRNHPLKDIFSALYNNKLEIDNFREYRYSPFNLFEKPIEFQHENFINQTPGNDIPLIYSLVATKPVSES